MLICLDMIHEKSCRGFLRSNVEKNLNDSTVVILDSLNYIKGFRYELFVLARNAKSTHAVVSYLFALDSFVRCFATQVLNKLWITIHATKIILMSCFLLTFQKEWNSRILKVRLNLLPIDRWDSPLFVVSEDQETPFEDICQTLLFDKKKSRDPVSTKQDMAKTGNYLHDLDKALQSILDQIIK